MSIVLPLGCTVKAYLRRYGRERPGLPLRCGCGSDRPLQKHGRYWRWVAERRERHQIPIYRWLCPSCRRTVSVLPDFLRPYAHFVSGLRECAVRRRLHGGRPWRELVRAVSSEAVGLVSEKTLRRCVAQARQLAGMWGTHLTEWLLRAVPAVDPFALVARREGPDARLHYLLTLGDWLRRHLRSPATDGHPEVFAFLSRFHGLSAHF